MPAFLLAAFLLIGPGPSTDTLDACLQNAPSRSEPPIGYGSELQQMWSDAPPVPLDTVRTYLSQLREARRCFLALDPSTIERPYLGNLMRTYFYEAAHLAALRRFSDAFATMDEAQSVLKSSPSIPAKPQVRSSWGVALPRDQGYLHYLLGNLSSAIDHYLTALQETPEDDVSQRITLLLDIGLLHQRTQDYTSADHYHQRANRLFDDDDLSVRDRDAKRARLLQNRADLLLEKTLNTTFDRGTLQKAKTLAQRGRALAPPDSERHARVTMALSESLGYLGEFERAYRLNEEVLQYARTHQHVRLQTVALLKLGILHLQTERWPQADSSLHEALARAKDLSDLDYQRRILRALGRLHEMQEQWAQAADFYRKGVAVIEEYRESLTASQWSMTAFAQWRDVHRGLVRSLLAQNQPREALTVLDRSRARHLQDLRTRARVSNQLPSEQRARLDSLSRALTDVRNRLGEDSLSNGDRGALRNRETALMAARQQLLQLDSDPDRPSLDTISETLAREERALVSYFLDDPWPVYDRSPRSVAFVLTGDSLRTVPLPGLTQDSVRTHVEAISPLFTSADQAARANAMHFDLRPLHRLHDLVYAPVAEHLADRRPLTVIPDGPLFHVPFSMLVTSMSGGPYAPSEARYVLHERPTSLELVSSLVADTARWSAEWSQFEPKLAAYGVSSFDTLRSVPPSLRTAIPEAVADSSLALPSLPGVEEELRALESTVSDARVVLNEEVSERAFCRSARTAGVLHVASHALVNASSPLRNAILLRPGQRKTGPAGAGSDSSTASPGPSDGVLFLHELQEQQSRIPMVVLSGCNTAAGTLRGGEGMEGLQYAFRAMGAQSTVSSLWPVADQASVELMDAFYKHLQAGRPKDVALHRAQLDFLESNPQKASPFFWAPPVLYGSPAALPLDDASRTAWTWWIFPGAGLTLALLLGWWLWFRNGLSVRQTVVS